MARVRRKGAFAGGARAVAEARIIKGDHVRVQVRAQHAQHGDALGREGARAAVPVEKENGELVAGAEAALEGVVVVGGVEGRRGRKQVPAAEMVALDVARAVQTVGSKVGKREEPLRRAEPVEVDERALRWGMECVEQEEEDVDNEQNGEKPRK